MDRFEKLMVRLVLSDVFQHSPDPVDLISSEYISTYGDGFYQLVSKLEGQQLATRLDSGQFAIGEAYSNF